MKKTVVFCDRCNHSPLKEHREIGFIVGSQIDIPTSRSEDVVESVDLCINCLGILLQCRIKDLRPEVQKDLYTRLKEHRV